MADTPRTEGDSALIVAIPEAEPIVADLRERHDVAGEGVPAHVTVIYPFLPASEIDEDTQDRLREHFAAMDAFDYRFTHAARLGPSTVVLEPEPAARFSALIDRTAAAWPNCPPYGGIYDEVVPHLTVGDRLDAEELEQLLAVVHDRLAESQPITGRATEVLLLLASGGGWSAAGRYSLRDTAS